LITLGDGGMLWFGMRTLTPKVLSEIDAAVAAARRTGSLIRIYAEAENIRRSNLADNIALEDIVEELMIQCACGQGFELDPYEALESLIGDKQIWRRWSATVH
jgi:hypothetical protein